MFKWLKSLFGSDIPDTPEIAKSVDVQETVKPEPKVTPVKKPTKKKATKKAAKVDLDSMKKNELLAHAKANGIKANASMNKAALIEAIKNG